MLSKHMNTVRQFPTIVLMEQPPKMYTFLSQEGIIFRETAHVFLIKLFVCLSNILIR